MRPLRTVVTCSINTGLRILGLVPLCILGNSYTTTLTAFGGSGAGYKFTESGSLPSGISFVDNGDGTCTIAGTTSDPGSFPFTLTLQDGDRTKISMPYTFVVQPLPLTISGHISGGAPGAAATGTYTISGGVAPYTVTVSAGSSPCTGDFSNTGAAQGTWINGSHSWTVHVVDSLGTPVDINDSCTNTYATLTLSGAPYADALLGVAYSQYLTISGGSGSYLNPRLTVGTLPAGLSISIASGNHLLISGTPTALGAPSITVAVDSSDSQTATSSQTFTVDTHYADDYVSPLVAYGLTKIIRGYSGALIRVQRTSDSTETDIGFVTNGVALDTSTLASFGAGTDCYVVKWYDQTGGGNYMKNSAGVTHCPLIVISGTVQSALICTSSSSQQYLETLSNVTYSTTKMTCFSRLSWDYESGSDFRLPLDFGYTVNGALAEYDYRSATGVPNWVWIGGGPSYNNIRSFSGVPASFSSTTYTMLMDNTAGSTGQFSVWLSGSSISSAAGPATGTPSGNIPTAGITIGSFGGGSYYTKSTWSSLVVCAGDQSSQRANVEATL